MSARSNNETVDRRTAAKLLAVSERTVMRYVAAGKVRRDAHRGGWGVRRSDVLTLAESRRPAGGIRPTVRAGHVLARRVEVLVTDLASGIEILELQRQPLALDPDELASLYRCADAFTRDGWPAGSERTWAEVVLRLHVRDLAVLARLTADPAPWRPFFRLLAGIAATSDTPARLLIDAALAHLAELAETWAAETDGVRAIQRQLRDLGCEPNRALVRRRQADRART